MLRKLMFSTMVAGVALAMSGVPASAQEGVPMFGSGPDRVCNIVIDSAGEAVLQTDSANPVEQTGTFACPEEVMAAVVEPAAPPPLLESGEVLFPLDEYTITPEAQQALSSMIFDIKDRQLEGISVVGHTDTSCPPEADQAACAAYNQTLSEKRATAVAQALVTQGVPVPPGNITTTGVGMTQLAVQTKPRTVKAANRRAVIDFE